MLSQCGDHFDCLSDTGKGYTGNLASSMGFGKLENFDVS